VQIDLGKDTHDHFVTPEERLNLGPWPGSRLLLTLTNDTVRRPDIYGRHQS
jgi:hypothetical protein